MPQGDGYETDPEGGNDSLYGGAGNDLLDGQGGNDRLSASIGDDVLVDSLGTNRLFGGDGNDYLSTGSGLESGGRGFDWLDAENYDHGARINLNGGGEGDSFRAFLNGTDDPSIAHTTITVEDFHRGQGDRLLLAAGVTQADGSHYIQGADLFNAFDSNHSGKLGDGDAHAFADAGGVHAQWFNTDIIIHGDATSAADWLS
jgi:Ca2+-binding RTX toxin-like protein